MSLEIVSDVAACVTEAIDDLTFRLQMTTIRLKNIAKHLVRKFVSHGSNLR